MDKVPTINDIIDSFPEVPAAIQGEPTYATIKTLRDTLKNNASSVDTVFGGGLHGHLGLVLPPHIYNMFVPPTHAGNSWIDPVDPGFIPAMNPQWTQEQRQQRQEEHKQVRYCWKLCYAVDQALKKQVTKLVEPMYLHAIEYALRSFTYRHQRPTRG